MMSLSQADVGILHHRNEDDDDDKSSVGKEEDDGRPSSTRRRDVFNALNGAKFVGVACLGGNADATATDGMMTLPFTPGLYVDGIGKISLPITPHHAREIKKSSWKTNDDVYTNIYQFTPQDNNNLFIQNPTWDVSISKLIQKVVAPKLGVDPDSLSAKLEMLLYMEKGSSIDWCTNVEEGEEDNVIGTMLIQLPSVFTGGKISVFHGDEELEDEDEEDFITSFDMGAQTPSSNTLGTSEAEFACHFLCHYSDCQYQMEKITSGSRTLLRYSLCYKNNSKDDDGVKPTAMLLRNSVVPLQSSLSLLPRADRMFLVPLKKYYSPSLLGQSGINVLSYKHRAKGESLRVAGKSWKVLIVSAANHFSFCYHEGMGDYSFSKPSIEGIFDELGNKVDLKWLQDMINFYAVEGATEIEFDHHFYDEYFDEPDADENPSITHVEKNEDGVNGMLLTHSKQIVDNWGERKKRKTKTDHYKGYTDYANTSYEQISIYKATFLLAYDEDSVLELKCQSGDISEVVKDVIEKQDCGLLDRLLDVVQAKGLCLNFDDVLNLECLARQANDCSIVSSFARVASKSLCKTSNVLLARCLSSGSQKVSMLLTCIRIIIDHGGQNELDMLGSVLVAFSSVFTPLCSKVAEVSIEDIDSQSLLVDMLNKLLVQQSMPQARQRVKAMLDANPNLAHLTDEDGRLPLHYAAANGLLYETVTCILQANPKAASVRDPVTGLYPFMLSGSNKNTAATLDLLLANPNLVMSGIPGFEAEDENDDGDGKNDKKRKRSAST